VAKDGDVYRLFSTHGGIRSYHSTDLAHWTRDPDVFATIPSWVHEQLPENPNDLWAPDISWWGGTWHLYYAASVWNGPPTRNSAIGHATSPPLDPADPRCGWTDHGPVVSSRGTFIDATSTDGWNAIDPNVVLDERGTPWLAWGSAFDGIFVQPLASDGTLAAGSAPTRLARRGAWFAVVEAATVVHHDGAWWLFASYDFCCRGAASNYHVRVGRASALTGPYLDRDGRPLDSPRDGSPLELDGGTKVLTGTDAAPGPGHQAILQDGDRWWIVHHWYDPSRNGESDVAIRPLDWGADGWPAVRGWHP
jgi:arabinan endo-1,5-alpha-L-arabinosidase